jgi:hypothetical protein
MFLLIVTRVQGGLNETLGHLNMNYVRKTKPND